MIPIPRQVSDLIEDELRLPNVEVLDAMTSEERIVLAAAIGDALTRSFHVTPLEDPCSSE